MIALNGLPDSWDPFIQSISGRAEFPSFDRLWSDSIQEESHLVARGMHKGTHGGDQHVLASQHVKRKGGHWKKNNFKRDRDFRPPAYDSRKKPRDLSRVRCFKCVKFGHYAKECQNPPMQGEANLNEVANLEDNEDYLFIFALSSNVPTDSNTWLIDSGASRHIIEY